MVLRLLPLWLIVALVIWLIYLNRKAMKNEPRIISMPLPGDRKAVTMPPFGIYVEPESKDNPEVLKHEECHWKQYHDKGLIEFYKDYFRLKSLYDYGENPMEVECFIAQQS